MLFAAAALIGTAVSAQAADWPSRPVTFIVPFPPGGNTDALARLVAQRLTTVLGQPVVVENKPGAGSMLGSQVVARATPDGHTFLVGSIANALNHYFYKKPLYDITKDLVPVSQLVNVPNYLAVTPGSPLKSMADIVNTAKTSPEKLSCATTGVGTSTYLSCELFKQMTGTQFVNVPYKGGAAAMTDVIGGQATMVFANEALPFIKDKRLAGIAVTTARRSPLADLPAMSETLPGFDVTSWYGVFAPAGTPQPIIDKLSSEIARIMKGEDIQAHLVALGATAVGSSAKEFQVYVDAELLRWSAVIRKLNVQLD
jgi:tripartite-type tricarboxylate transporter receptor subunit TctC